MDEMFPGQWPLAAASFALSSDTSCPVSPPYTRLNGIPYFLRMMGEMRVILCRRKASQPWELPGKKPRAEKTSISLAGRGGACPVGRGSRAAGTPLSGQPFPPRPRGNETHRGLRDGVLGDEGRTHSTHPWSQTGCGCPETTAHPELPSDKSHCVASTQSLGHVRAQPGHKTGELLLLTRHTVTTVSGVPHHPPTLRSPQQRGGPPEWRRLSTHVVPPPPGR